jgi:tetratricopeptide (TPR) repeat protein
VDAVAARAMRANILLELGRPEEALAEYDRVVKLTPQNAAVWYNRGNVLQMLRRHEEALASYDRALALTPDDIEVLTNRGIALYELKRYQDALASYEHVLAMKPDFAQALSNRANVLLDLRRPEEALASSERALELNPQDVGTWNNRGIALQVLHRDREALASYDKAIALEPQSVEAHWNGSLCRLLLGDYANGWKEYEWRWRAEDFLALTPKRSFVQPLWLGNEDLQRKKILLHAEQGFGDTIQFCRYVEQVAKKGARVLLEVEPALKSLMTSSFGYAEVHAKGDAPPQFDYYCPLASLPLAFQTQVDTIPANVPYLNPSPQHIEKWRLKLASHKRPWIGLAWSGRITHTKQHERSIPLHQLSPITKAAASFFSLQKDIQAGDQALIRTPTVINHFGDELADFSHTAALVSLMDVVISIDTSVAHLAGALAKPVWVMLPYVADWRWLLERDDSPWYPTARLFRQAAAGDWEGVIKRVKGELDEYSNSFCR